MTDDMEMRLLPGLTLFACLAMAETSACAQIYRQADLPSRITTYTNFPLPSQEAPGQPIPVQLPREPSPQAKPSSEAKPSSFERPKKTATTIHDGFPRVSKQLQKERDSERLRLLQQELAMEQSLLEQVLKAKAEDNVVQRHKANIEALRREIDRAR